MHIISHIDITLEGHFDSSEEYIFSLQLLFDFNSNYCDFVIVLPTDTRYW